MSARRVIDDHIELVNIGVKTHAEIESHIQGIGNYAFPSADGNADQLLKTSGAGVLSWIDQPAGFACGSLNACNLTDIGTRPHSQLTGIGTSDHHVKYTDAEAVSAADASDKFVERGVVNVATDTTELKRTATGDVFKLKREYSVANFVGNLISGDLDGSSARTYQEQGVSMMNPQMRVIGSDKSRTIGYIMFYKQAGVQNSSLRFTVANTSAASIIRLIVNYDSINVMSQPIQNPKNHVDATLSGTPKLVEFWIGTTPYYFKIYPTKT